MVITRSMVQLQLLLTPTPSQALDTAHPMPAMLPPMLATPLLMLDMPLLMQDTEPLMLDMEHLVETTMPPVPLEALLMTPLFHP